MDYTIIVHKGTSGYYCGQCVQLPGAISQGKTLEELMTNMREAISMILEYNKEQALKSTKGEKVFYRKIAMV